MMSQSATTSVAPYPLPPSVQPLAPVAIIIQQLLVLKPVTSGVCI